MFGRNEGGGQRFHRWLERLIDTDDDGLAALFDETKTAAPTLVRRTRAN